MLPFLIQNNLTIQYFLQAENTFFLKIRNQTHGLVVKFPNFWPHSGVAPGIFRRGLTLPTKGLEYGF